MMKKEIKLLTAGLAIAIIGGISSIGIYKSFEPKQEVIIQQPAPKASNYFTNNKDLITQPKSFELAAEMSLNAVVHVKTETLRNQQVDPLYEFFYGNNPRQQQPVLSSGSGVIISRDGYIVTNNHVIEDAEKINITLNNKKTYEAKLIGTDPNTDLALVKIDHDHLPAINYGNSNELNVGEWVLAVGNPFNLTSTVTAGIVSAKGRDINILRNDPNTGVSAIESFIQTDAAVNPGNSGGALVNTSGELIGINSAIKSNTGSFAGYSFAIPVNIVKKVVKDLKEFGKVQRAFIGINIRSLDEQLAEEIGVKDLNGIYVAGTTENGSAEKAGIKAGDIIKKVDHQTVVDVPSLQEELSQYRPGDKVIISLLRDDKYIEIPVTLKNLNGNESIVKKEESAIAEVLGAKLSTANNSILKKLNISGGVLVDKLYNGKLRNAGIKEGFVITSINRNKVQSVKEITTLINKTKGGILIEGFYQNGQREFYGLGIR